MARRSRAREVALQLLYELDRNPAIPENRDRGFVESRLRGAGLRQFALDLIAGVRTKREDIDRIIQEAAQNWTVGRMTPIDRSILRLATFEILFCTDTPAKVAIDEAIELAKRFGTAESSRFVNGILDRIVTTHPRRAGPVDSAPPENTDLAPPIDSLNPSGS
jgi:N utilization substance protein B